MRAKGLVNKRMRKVLGMKNNYFCISRIQADLFCHMRTNAACDRGRAFSLIEILCVVALFSILMGATLPALLSSRRSAALTRGGNLMADISTYARQTALSKNTATAVIIADKVNAIDKQAVTVIEYDSVLQSWKQNNAWSLLPEAVEAADSTPDKSTLLSMAPAIITLGNKDLTGYSALVFFPDGRMDNPSADARQIKVGFVERSSSDNYYNLVFSTDTSSFRILRPE